MFLCGCLRVLSAFQDDPCDLKKCLMSLLLATEVKVCQSMCVCVSVCPLHCRYNRIVNKTSIHLLVAVFHLKMRTVIYLPSCFFFLLRSTVCLKNVSTIFGQNIEVESNVLWSNYVIKVAI